jgi:hypothetical protein
MYTIVDVLHWICVLEESDTRPPIIFRNRFRVHDDLVGERIGIGGGNGRYVVFVSIDNGDDLMRGFFERLGHGTADFQHVCSLGQSNFVDTMRGLATYQSRSVAVQVSHLMSIAPSKRLPLHAQKSRPSSASSRRIARRAGLGLAVGECYRWHVPRL